MSAKVSIVKETAHPTSTEGYVDDQKWIEKVVKERGLFSGILTFPRDNGHWLITIALIALAYLLSFWVRLEWIDFAQANYVNEQGETVYFHPQMVRDGVALPNTHDSFYFGSILQKAHLGMHENNNLIPSAMRSGMITMLPYWLLQLYPNLSIETLLLWLPVFVAGIVCIPIILIGRLYGSHAWGFFAACLAGVTHSYYNRTLAGYYDTDMFSITIPAFALYFLLSASRRKSLNYALSAALTLYLYRFFYTSGQAITGAMSVAFIGYSFFLVILEFFIFNKGNFRKSLTSPTARFVFQSSIMIAFAAFAESWSYGLLIELNPGQFIFGFLFLFFLRFIFIFLRFHSDSTREVSKVLMQGNLGENPTEDKWRAAPFKKNRSFRFPTFYFPPVGLLIVSLSFVGFAIFKGDVQDKIFAKLDRYVSAGKGESVQTVNKEKGYSLSYLDVFSTVREASGIPSDVVRNRILADTPNCSCPRCIPPKDKAEASIIPTAMFGLLGVLLIILRYWEFCIAIPFLAIAYFCFEGAVGLRFTVHVGNIAALGITFLILAFLWALLTSPIAKKLYGISSPSEKVDKLHKTLQKPPKIVVFLYWISCCLLFVGLIWPNVQHAKNYHSHVVYPNKTIEVLEKLNDASDPEDFVVTWWDYGSGCWFYGGARTFTSPAHQTFDNYLTSEILRSRNPLRAINLSRLKTETYLDVTKRLSLGESIYSTAVQAIFRDGQSDLEFYQGILHDLEKGIYPLPDQTRDIFLFMPYEILRIFPTILSFSSRNLYFSDSQTKQSAISGEIPLKILRNGRNDGGLHFNFDEGFRFDRNGDFRLEGPQSGKVTYSQLWVTSGDKGQPAKLVRSVESDGFKIISKPDNLSKRVLLFVESTKDLVILSSNVFHSTFAKRFLFDSFDPKAFAHPVFETGANPVSRPFITQADWITRAPNGITLNMRGGYKIEADLKSQTAKIPGIKDPVPFSFHQRIHNKKTGQLTKVPSRKLDNSKFHLIQSSLPMFSGGRTYEVPQGGRNVATIAESFGISVEMLGHHLGLNSNDVLAEGKQIEIPASGYQIASSWFFMDNQSFESLLIQGFLMEELPEKYFEKIYSSPWGKVYKIVR